MGDRLPDLDHRKRIADVGLDEVVDNRVVEGTSFREEIDLDDAPARRTR